MSRFSLVLLLFTVGEVEKSKWEKRKSEMRNRRVFFLLKKITNPFSPSIFRLICTLKVTKM